MGDGVLGSSLNCLASPGFNSAGDGNRMPFKLSKVRRANSGDVSFATHRFQILMQCEQALDQQPVRFDLAPWRVDGVYTRAGVADNYDLPTNLARRYRAIEDTVKWQVFKRG